MKNKSEALKKTRKRVIRCDEQCNGSRRPTIASAFAVIVYCFHCSYCCCHSKTNEHFFFVRCKVWQLGLYVWILFFRFIIGRKYAKNQSIDRNLQSVRIINSYVHRLFLYMISNCVFLFCNHENKRVRTTKIEVNSFISFSAKIEWRPVK